MESKYIANLPADDAVQNWFEENIDKECSASSAIYKFRLWLESLQREFQAKRQQAIGLGLIEEEHHGSVWVKADQKPEHNVGVLVFIPGEDNHITSGMWDISNEWVLLDEYRTPEVEVTHWMPLPAFPEGYTHDVISDEWVSTLKAIAKEELSKKNESAAGRGDAVAFAEWCANNYRWEFEPYSEEYKWMKGDIYYSTEQLHERYLQQKG